MEFLEILWHATKHSLKHSLVTLLVIFLCYVLIELLEDTIFSKYKKNRFLKGKFAPVVSAGFGLIPQCGFSVVITELYSKGAITIGSLIAIFIATSDEALPILLSNPSQIGNLCLILVIKFVYAVLVGLSIDAIFRNQSKPNDLLVEKVSIPHSSNDTKENPHNHSSSEHCEDEHYEVQGCCHHSLKGGRKTVKDLFVHPLVHALKIFSYILIINIIFHVIMEYVGEDAVKNFMNATGVFQPFLAALVGLIPNCSASVIITELFISGGLSLGSCLAGLSVNSGIALIVLFKLNKKKVAENVFITVSLYLLGVLLGLIVNLFV